MLAQALRALGRRAEAAEQLGHALVAGGPAAWWAELADDYEALNRPDRARDAWQQAIALAPDDPVARYRYGCLLGRFGDLPSAAAHLQAAVALRPNFAVAHARLAELAVDERQAAGGRRKGAADAPHEDELPMTPDEALESARRAVALQPEESDHWRVLGAILRLRGANDESAHALRRAHELDPGNAQAAFLLGLVALERGAAAEAVVVFTAAVASAPIADYHGHLALAHRWQVMLPCEPDDLRAPSMQARLTLDQAQAELARAVELEPLNLRWWCELGIVEQLLGHHDAAIAAFDRCLMADDRTGTIYRAPTSDEAASVQRLYCMSSAAATYRRSTERESDTQHVPHAEIRHRRALSLYLAGRLAEARADQESVLAQAHADGHDHYLLGRMAFEMGDLEKARVALVAAVAANPANSQAQLFLGNVLIGLGQAADAISALERAVELRPDHAPSVAALSTAHAAQGRHERALVEAMRAVRLDSNVPEYHQHLAGLYATAGRLNEARAALINAMTLRPDVAAWHAQMGEICRRMGMQDAARNAYARAVQLAPSDTDYLYALARLLEQQGQVAEAKAVLERAVERTPERGAWRYELGRLQQQLGDEGAALEHYTSAVQNAPEAAVHWHALVEAQRRSGALDLAQETAERALVRFGDEAIFHAAAGALLDEQGDYAAVAWHYTIAVEREPGVAEHWWRLGRARLELGDLAGARAALEQALSIDPDTAEAHAVLARIFAQQDDARATLVHIQRAAELMPNDLVYQTQLAETYTHMRRFEDAYQALRRALELAPNDPETLVRYGEMALNVARNSEALDAFERAATLQPDEPRYHFLAGKAHRRLKHYSRAIERYRRAVRLRPGYSEAIIELSTLGPLAFVAHHLRGADQDAAA